jgi:DNA-binding beta-propeller fold protein YncE
MKRTVLIIVLLGSWAFTQRASAQATATATATPTPPPCCQAAGSLSGFTAPAGMCLDYATNRLYVADFENNRVQVFNGGTAGMVTIFSSMGSNGTLDNPIDVAVDADSNIYVADLGKQEVEKFDSSYNYICSIGQALGMEPSGVWAQGTSVYASNLSPFCVYAFTGSGTAYAAAATFGKGSLNNPDGLIQVGQWLYVTDTFNDQVVKFDTTDPAAAPVTVGSPLLFPAGIRTDLAGDFYVTEGNNGDSPEYVDTFNPGFNVLLNRCPQTGGPWGVAVNPSGVVFVSGINTSTVTEIKGCIVEPTITPSYQGSDPPGPGQCFIYPSPARGTTATVSYDMAQAGAIELKVWNWKGGWVGQVTDQKPAGVQVTPFDISGLATGVYFYDLKITYDSGSGVTIPPQKFVIIH